MSKGQFCENCIHRIVCNHENKYSKVCSQFLETRPHGEWVFKNGKYRCSVCLEPCATFCMNEPRDNFCLCCGSDNRPKKRGLRAKMGLIDDAADEKPDFEYIKVGNTIYTQDDDKQGWTGRERE